MYIMLMNKRICVIAKLYFVHIKIRVLYLVLVLKKILVCFTVVYNRRLGVTG